MSSSKPVVRVIKKVGQAKNEFAVRGGFQNQKRKELRVQHPKNRGKGKAPKKRKLI